MTDDNFDKILLSQKDNFDTLVDMVNTLCSQLTSYSEESNGSLNKLSEIEEFMENEKRKVAIKIETEKHTEMLDISKALGYI